MKKDKRLEKLSKEELVLLKQAQDISEILETPGWKAISLFIQQSIVWPDPKTYHSREEAIIPYTEAYGSAEMAKKLFEFVSSQKSTMESITKKLDEETNVPNWNVAE